MQPWQLSRLSITSGFPMTGLPYNATDNSGMDTFLEQLIYWYLHMINNERLYGWGAH